MMSRTWPILTAAAILLLSGAGHGLWTGRWRESDEVVRAVAQLDRLPLTLGDWQGRPAAATDPKILARAGISGCLSRHYVNRRDGSMMSVMLMCGPPGPIATHPPEICMMGAGFEATSTTGKVLASSGAAAQAAEFKAVTFRKPGPTNPMYLNLFWSWNALGAWTTPDYPRLAFAPHPVLYKLYVSRQTTQDGRRLQDDPCLGFLKVLLPAIETSLFSGHRPAARAPRA